MCDYAYGCWKMRTEYTPLVRVPPEDPNRAGAPCRRVARGCLRWVDILCIVLIILCILDVTATLLYRKDWSGGRNFECMGCGGTCGVNCNECMCSTRLKEVHCNDKPWTDICWGNEVEVPLCDVDNSDNLCGVGSLNCGFCSEDEYMRMLHREK